MRRDRVAENIYAFISDLYVQAAAGVVLTEAGAVVIDTLPFPQETREMIAFVEDQLGPGSIRYVVLTHFQADHVYGAYLFHGAEVIAHDRCRVLLDDIGRRALEQAKRDNPMLADVQIRLPDMTFEREMFIQLGERHLRLMHAPGHTEDGTIILEEDDEVLFAGDLAMPIPHIVDGDMEQFQDSLLRIKALEPDFVVQGHGEVLLAGEVAPLVDGHIEYMGVIQEKVGELLRKGASMEALSEIDIEDCGISRLPLDGAVTQLHESNLRYLYQQMIE